MEVAKREITVSERDFVIMATYDRGARSLRVWVQTKDGEPVVITRPNPNDASKALEYTEEFTDALGVPSVFANSLKESAERLMETAEAHLRYQIDRGWV